MRAAAVGRVRTVAADPIAFKAHFSTNVAVSLAAVRRPVGDHCPVDGSRRDTVMLSKESRPAPALLRDQEPQDGRAARELIDSPQDIFDIWKENESRARLYKWRSVNQRYRNRQRYQTPKLTQLAKPRACHAYLCTCSTIFAATGS